MSKFEIVKEFFAFVKTRKRYWLIPVIVILVLLGLLLVLSESSPLAPFIYSLF